MLCLLWVNSLRLLGEKEEGWREEEGRGGRGEGRGGKRREGGGREREGEVGRKEGREGGRERDRRIRKSIFYLSWDEQ